MKNQSSSRWFVVAAYLFISSLASAATIVEVDNHLTELEVAGETELTGAGGVILNSLELPAGARLVSELQNERPALRILPVSLAGRPEAFCSLRKIRLAPAFSDLEFSLDGRPVSLRLPLPGAFNAANYLTALSMAYGLGLPFDGLLEASAAMPHVPGRLQAAPAMMLPSAALPLQNDP